MRLGGLALGLREPLARPVPLLGQGRAEPVERALGKLVAVTVAQRVEGVEHDLGVAGTREPPAGLAQPRVLLAVGIGAELVARQAQDGARPLEGLARRVDSLARPVAALESLARDLHLPARDPPQAVVGRLGGAEPEAPLAARAAPRAGVDSRLHRRGGRDRGGPRHGSRRPLVARGHGVEVPPCARRRTSGGKCESAQPASAGGSERSAHSSKRSCRTSCASGSCSSSATRQAR